jgi:CSLREA domain-containing protein
MIGRNVLIPVVLAVAGLGSAQAADFWVNVTSDTNDGVCSAAHCSLREAVIEANRHAGYDNIWLPAGHFTLSIQGTFEDVAATGDLDLLEGVALRGQGAWDTRIDADRIDRVFHTLANQGYIFEDLTVTGGGNLGQGGLGGGGIWFEDGSATITRCNIVDNETGSLAGVDYHGGGLLFSSPVGNHYLDSVIFNGNRATHGGGLAILDPSNDFYINTTTMIANEAAGDGGAVFNQGNPTFVNSTIFNNTAGHLGGAVVNRGNIVLGECTISGNTAGMSIGGMWIADGSVWVRRSTIADNSSWEVFVSPGTGAVAEFTNTIIEGGCSGDVDAISSLGGNLESPGDTCNLSTDDLKNVSTGSLDLSPLGYYGGPTYTHVPMFGSAAIDYPLAAVHCSSADQRGHLRPKDGDLVPGAVCDIGSVEAHFGELLVVNGDFTVDVAGWHLALPASSSLIHDLLDANMDPMSGSGVGSNLSRIAGDSVYFEQCAEGVEGGSVVGFGAKVLLPVDQAATGEAYLELVWYPDPGCTGSPLGQVTTPPVTSGIPGGWQTSKSGRVQAPVGRQTMSALLRIVLTKNEAAGSLEAYFDQAFFGDYAPIFSDGFSLGNASAWSRVAR